MTPRSAGVQELTLGAGYTQSKHPLEDRRDASNGINIFVENPDSIV